MIHPENIDNLILYWKSLPQEEMWRSIKKDILESNRVKSILGERLRHPWKYLAWYLKQRVHGYKIKISWKFFPKKEYER